MSGDKPSDIAAEAVVWALIETVAKQRKDEARAKLNNLMGPDSAAVKGVANGKTIGRATWVEPKDVVAVTSELIFYEYVRHKWPDALVPTVNPAFRKALLDGAKIVDGKVVDRDGEIMHGVDVRESASYVSVRKSPESRAVVEELLSGGRLGLDGITQPQLAEGDRE